MEAGGWLENGKEKHTRNRKINISYDVEKIVQKFKVDKYYSDCRGRPVCLPSAIEEQRE